MLAATNLKVFNRYKFLTPWLLIQDMTCFQQGIEISSVVIRLPVWALERTMWKSSVIAAHWNLNFRCYSLEQSTKNMICKLILWSISHSFKCHVRYSKNSTTETASKNVCQPYRIFLLLLRLITNKHVYGRAAMGHPERRQASLLLMNESLQLVYIYT